MMTTTQPKHASSLPYFSYFNGDHLFRPARIIVITGIKVTPEFQTKWRRLANEVHVNFRLAQKEFKEPLGVFLIVS